MLKFSNKTSDKLSLTDCAPFSEWDLECVFGLHYTFWVPNLCSGQFNAAFRQNIL